ncbi:MULTISPECIES: acetolactate decarboxylase [Microbacterium]|uniref:acetolactate decarboxylase n=1 Tax=Microbacterium TaxID=33882 RepID=UPI00277E7C88|nr:MULTISPECIES: acetolactate decarboxylase [Microbacterium]MDQ1084541.1 acetolactate decarboxylase [Microbacterium sp. SORGH_AS_0344]MDQ1170181.1 acetolactate decarboxylase [Microbacterium proteolyticum]
MSARLTSGAVTQFAVLDALLAGVFSQGSPVADVRAAGDTGVGCCEGLGGEVVIVDGAVYECTADGPPRLMAEEELLPFVDVCFFGDAIETSVSDLDLPGLDTAVQQGLLSRNLFHAVRVDGTIARVLTRVPRPQRPPFRPLAEVAAEQIETTTLDCPGSLVGFWMPRIYQGITVAGLHLHFLSDDRSIGGHVLDLRIGEARLRVSAFADLHLRLPREGEFLSTELTHDDDRRIVAVEGRSASRSSPPE